MVVMESCLRLAILVSQARTLRSPSHSRLLSCNRNQVSEVNLVAISIAGWWPIAECARTILHVTDLKDIELGNRSKYFRLGGKRSLDSGRSGEFVCNLDQFIRHYGCVVRRAAGLPSKEEF
jgi:hypothetical protein